MIGMYHDFGGWPSFTRLSSPKNNPSRPAVPVTGGGGGGESVESPASREALLAKLEYAEQRFKLVEAQHNAATVPEAEYLAAKRDRDVAAAEVKGDKQTAARVRLEYAEQLLKFVDAQYHAAL